MKARRLRKTVVIGTMGAALLAAPACSTVKNVIAPNSETPERTPIRNPFGTFSSGPGSAANDTMIFRTKKGDGAVEVEVPRTGEGISDFVIPISPKFAPGYRGPASVSDASESGSVSTGGDPQIDSTYKDREAGPTDREIVRTFPQVLPEDENKRQEIEQDLGLVRSEDNGSERSRSYLAQVDKVKQLYRYGRFEAALLELDSMVRDYPTNPKLHAMRGTLLERLGKGELAMKSWKQALKLDPANQSLRKFVDRREQKRSVASQ